MSVVSTGIVRDVRLAWRGLTRRKGFFLLVVLILSVGFGSAGAAFGVFEAVQVRPLPFVESERLVQLAVAHEERPLEAEPLYRQDLLAFSEHGALFTGLGGFTTGTANLSDDGRPERLDAGFVTPGLFPLLGVQPAAGRGFSDDDARPGAPVVVLLSDELWRHRYASAPDVVGRQIRVNRQPATVIGVMPAGFAFPHQQRLWLPLPWVASGDAADTTRLVAIGRLTAGAAHEVVSGVLQPTFDDARRRHPERYQGYNLLVQPLSWFFVDWQARAGHRLLFVAVIALLLVAVANATGLLLAHARERENEWALRAALGAPRGDTLRATLASGLIVSAAGLALAVPLTRAALVWLEGEMLRSEDPMPYFLHLGLTGPTIAFLTAAAAVTALVSGLLPGLRLGTPAMAGTAGQWSRTTGSRTAARAAGVLVAAQVSLSLVVVVTMAVLVQGVERMARRDLGVDPRHVMTARVALMDTNYPQDADRARFWTQLVERLRRAPGVVAAAVGSPVPGYLGGVDTVRIEGAEVDRALVRVSTGAVDADFGEAYRVRLSQGRWFTRGDDAAAPRVAIVDRRFADAAWPGRDPVGRRIRGEAPDSDWVVVVGMTENLHLAQVDDPPRGTVLVPLLQEPPRFASLAVRTQGDPYSVVPIVRSEVERLDAELPLYWVRSLEDAIRHGYYNVRIFARIIGWLGLSALLMTGAGLYALIAGRIAQRTREIGIRRALGASGIAVSRSVLRQVTGPLGVGVTVGLFCAWPVGRALVAVEPTVLGAGSGTYALALVTLGAAAALAVAAPLARALVINPVDALRCD